MREIIAFIQKEFRHIFRDLRTTLIVLVMPVVQIILFGFAISTDVSNAVVDVVGDACDPLARSVISRIEGNKYLAVGEIHGSFAPARDRIRKGKAAAALCFGTDFDGKAGSEGKACVRIVSDGSDPNTAPVVEYIYSMAEEGLGLHRIAKRLHDEKVLKPCYYKKEMFGRFIDDEKMYDWDSAYISQVLHSPVYAGHIIYEAKPTVSMKSKKRRYIPFEERAIVPNTHEAIIPQDRWENVQRILYSRSGCFMCDKTDYDNIFKGIVRCADCGRTMLVKVEHRRKRNSVLDQTFYCCSTYRKYGAKACDSHNLEARVLHEAVFADIQAHAKAAVSNREALVKKIANQMHLRVSSDRAQHKRDLKQCKARIAEIEDLYAKLYEDVSKGLLPEKRFQMLADRYDKEQAKLTEKIEQYEREGRAEHDQLDKIQDFIDEVSKYAGITELNYKILHQLIDKILVSKAEKVDGEYVQKIQIFYRFIGPLDAIE